MHIRSTLIGSISLPQNSFGLVFSTIEYGIGSTQWILFIPDKGYNLVPFAKQDGFIVKDSLFH